MMGFYLILGPNRSLREVGERLGTACPCMIHYRPGFPAGEACEVLAEMEDRPLATIHISIGTIRDDTVEDDVRTLLDERFCDAPLRVYWLSYRDPDFLEEIASLVLDLPDLWVIDDAGLAAGKDYLSRRGWA